MGVRDKIKKTFSKKRNGSGGSSPSGSPPLRSDIEYYKPDEIPRSKYRGKVDKEHQATLDAFSFADAFDTSRRRSSQALSGTFSPGGTESQSRRPSFFARSQSTLSAAVSADDEEEGDHTPEKESEDDDTAVASAELSRTATAKNLSTLHLEKTITAGPDKRISPIHGTPFTVEELEMAMTRVALEPRSQPMGITA